MADSNNPEPLLEDWTGEGGEPLSVNEMTELAATCSEAPPMDPRAKEILRMIVATRHGLNCPAELKQHGIVVALRDMITFEECRVDSLDFCQDDEDMRSPLRQIAEYFASKLDPGEIRLVSFTVPVSDLDQKIRMMRCEVSGFAI